MPPRVHPYAVVFGNGIDARFGAIRAAVDSDRSLDVFLAAAPTVELLHDLRPDAGLGDAIDDFVAFVHAAFWYWCDGLLNVEFDADATRQLCAPSGVAPPPGGPPQATKYIQVAPHLVWGQPVPDSPFEPLDGWFLVPAPGGVRMVACFGVHPARPGLSVTAADLDSLADLGRADRTEPFSPTMPGGERAGLYAVTTVAELQLLALRAEYQIEGRR